MPLAMSWVTTLHEAVRALGARLGRASLAVLMTAVGVATVIVLVGILGGAQRDVARRIQALGSNLVSIAPGVVSSGGARLGYGSRPSLTQNDIEAILRDVPGVVAINGIWWSGGQAIVGSRNWTTRIHGVLPGYFTVRNWAAERGRVFDEDDIAGFGKVAAIGSTIADKLFPGQDPVGQDMRLRNVPFRVVGVLEPKGQSFGGQDQDDIILVPLSTARLRLNTQLGPEFKRVSAISGRDRFRNPGEADALQRKGPLVTNPAAFQAQAVNLITVKMDDGQDITATEATIADVLRQRRPGGEIQGDNFQVRGHTELWRAQSETTRMLSLIVAIAGTLAIITSGAGIMNTMLIAVSERIPEIGVRLAVGARRRDILGQFLMESAMIAGLGGLFGLIAGLGAVSLIIAFKLSAPVLSATWVATVVGAAVVTGLFFGFYPAWRAARLDPVTCLRTP
ncbi:MAG: ABC transporter permease [Alphaproteobacteria bacterium]|nr:ABC transporter permease [Alphaproteobacteria bacterium]